MARRLQRLGGGGGAPGQSVAFDYERLDRPVKSLVCLGPDGEPIQTLNSSNFQGPGGSVWFTVPQAKTLHLRVVYFEKSAEITVPVRVETGVGF